MNLIDGELKTNRPVLEIKNLSIDFCLDERIGRAVDGLNFQLKKREVLGIVGESGCGKSVTALAIMRLIQIPPGKIVDGQIFLNGCDLLKIPDSEMGRIRGKEISMVFQEPLTSLNPVFTIGKQIAEIFKFQEAVSKKEAWNRAIEQLRIVKMPDPERRVFEYPHMMSGGMRQRVMIAMALSCNPAVMLADEPTTALDVTIQAQIIDLFLDLRYNFHSSIIFITHDLGIVYEVADRILVMYAGKMVEEADKESLFEDPQHPYTRGLMRSIPKFGQRSRMGVQRLEGIPGTVPRLSQLAEGCPFQPRCRNSLQICKHSMPPSKETGDNHKVRCWMYF
jgi:oligopeptide/dipeptide ABC transporter ATP-binding protein